MATKRYQICANTSVISTTESTNLLSIYFSNYVNVSSSLSPLKDKRLRALTDTLAPRHVPLDIALEHLATDPPGVAELDRPRQNSRLNPAIYRGATDIEQLLGLRDGHEVGIVGPTR